MVRKIGILFLLLICAGSVSAQHLIGLSREGVTEKMKETNFVIDNTSRNTTFNYIKFIDRFDEKTFLVFLSKDDICTSTKLMSDYSSFKKTVTEFNKKYKKISSNEWNYMHDGSAFKVIVKKEEWFYSVIVTPKNK